MEKKQSLIEQIWESWGWLLRNKLEDANEIACQMYQNCYIESGGRVNEYEYERFMAEKLSQIFKELGDAKQGRR
jgi:hypothetical protein